MQSSIYEELTSHLSDLEKYAIENKDVKSFLEVYEVKYLIDLVMAGENIMEDIGAADSRHEKLLLFYKEKVNKAFKEQFNEKEKR